MRSKSILTARELVRPPDRAKRPHVHTASEVKKSVRSSEEDQPRVKRRKYPVERMRSDTALAATLGVKKRSEKRDNKDLLCGREVAEGGRFLTRGRGFEVVESWGRTESVESGRGGNAGCEET
jgi:hypothetical protein